MRQIGKSVKKIDAKALILSRPVYTEDLASKDALVVKLLRSKTPFAKIIEIDKKRAEKIAGVECILTYEDMPKKRFTLAGQSYPEPSPKDRLILDEYVRYVGDPVAIVAGISEDVVDRALKLIRVKYEKFSPNFDPEKAEASMPVHPEYPENNLPREVVKYDYDKNIVGEINLNFGEEDVDSVYENSEIKLDRTYTTKAQSQSMMETFRSFSYLDGFSRLVVVSSTQVPFHIKRQLAEALEIPSSKIRVIKPRVGGGFGAKQTSESEVYAAIVTMKTKKPAKIIYSRKETFYGSNTRHPMKIRVKIGADNDGNINSIDMDVLSDQGAYGVHAWTTLRLAGEKSMPLYNKIKASRFHGKVVYTNKEPAGAFRGYGATQGIFALESAVNELAKLINMDPTELRLKNIVNESEVTVSFGKEIRSSKLKECIEAGKKIINWDENYPIRELGDGVYKSLGMAIAMQGSGIASIDVANAQIRLNEDGCYTLYISATDCGTGADTILTQIAAEVLKVDTDRFLTISADTDITPFDAGSYASSTTYTTGRAVKDAAEKMVELLKLEAAKILQKNPKDLKLNGDSITSMDLTVHISIKRLAEELSKGSGGKTLITNGYFGNDDSPPPFMAGFCQLIVDTKTGVVKVDKYVAVVDCGTVINENLARVQTEGGIVQGIGFALYEDVHYDRNGKFSNDSFMTYKIPTRLDIGDIVVEFNPSYEPTGPFGAKSIGELVINTPAPAIASAIAEVIKTPLRDLPFTPEKVFFAKEKL